MPPYISNTQVESVAQLNVNNASAGNTLSVLYLSTLNTTNSVASFYVANSLPTVTANTNGLLVNTTRFGPTYVANAVWYAANGITYSPADKSILYLWGDGGFGGLGDNTADTTAIPRTPAGGGTTWSKISVGYYNTSAVKSDGTLWTWGYNPFGELGDGTTTNRSSPGTVAGGGTTWSQTASHNRYFTTALKTDGTLWTWGYNNKGQLGSGSTTNRSSPGTVAGGGTNWSKISTGYGPTAAIKTDGTLWTWGANYNGALGDGTTTSRSSPGTVAGGGTTWSQVTAGSSYAIAIKTDGTLWSWGSNGSGQLGTGNTTSRSSPGTMAGGGTTWSQVAAINAVPAGRSSSAAIKTDGTLWTWGSNYNGWLGDGTTTNRSSPGTTAGGGTNWSQVAIGDDYMAAIKTDGTLWSWGSNYYGRLGDGSRVSRSSPGTTVLSGTGWIDVSAGKRHSAAIYKGYLL